MNNKYLDRITQADFDLLLKRAMLDEKDGKSANSVRIGLVSAMNQEDVKPDLEKEEALIEKLLTTARHKGLDAAGMVS
jgi:hypothetical protein